MSNTALQADKLASAQYQAARERMDCCAGCAYATAVRYQRSDGGAALLCAKAGGAIVASLGMCSKWRSKAVDEVPA